MKIERCECDFEFNYRPLINHQIFVTEEDKIGVICPDCGRLYVGTKEIEYKTKYDNNYMDVTDIDLIELAREVYRWSSPQGNCHFYFNPKDILTEEEIKWIIENPDTYTIRKDEYALYMDYIKARACKMFVYREDRRLYMRKVWKDHTNYQFRRVVTKVYPQRLECIGTVHHLIGCNCVDCKVLVH